MVNYKRGQKPKPVKRPELRTWTALNDALRTSNAATCRSLLRSERAGRARKSFLLRIHSRLNRVRADAERARIEKGVIK